jgi:hypothetical protein
VDASYLEGDLEDIIIRALLLYATTDPSATDTEREKALDWHHALQNDTWLMQTAEPPGE